MRQQTVPICQYCDDPAELVTGQRIYPNLRRLHALKFWLCDPCNAYVGTHKGTDRPFGVLSNLELRQAKQKAHKHFDELWIGKCFTRKEAYGLLAGHLDISKKHCHIGMFTVDMCNRVVEFAESHKTMI